MPYWRLFYHLVWATKGRAPLLVGDTETEIHRLVLRKAIGLGATVFALDGASDHMHLVGAVPPSIGLGDFVGKLKGASAASFNKLGANAFFWQEGYGAFSFDGSRLPHYVAYVERQKAHHAANTTIAVLERLEGEAPALLRETEPAYGIDMDPWRRELDLLG